MDQPVISLIFALALMGTAVWLASKMSFPLQVGALVAWIVGFTMMDATLPDKFLPSRWSWPVLLVGFLGMGISMAQLRKPDPKDPKKKTITLGAIAGIVLVIITVLAYFDWINNLDSPLLRRGIENISTVLDRVLDSANQWFRSNN